MTVRSIGSMDFERCGMAVLSTLIAVLAVSCMASDDSVRAEESNLWSIDESVIIPPDCERRKLTEELAVSQCFELPEGVEDLEQAVQTTDKGSYEIAFYDQRGESLVRITRRRAAVQLPPEPIEISAGNRRWVAFTQPDFKCERLRIVDLREGRLALTTGCWQNGHYDVRVLPGPGECRAVVDNFYDFGVDHDRPMGDHPQIQGRTEFDLCGEPLDLRRSE